MNPKNGLGVFSNLQKYFHRVMSGNNKLPLGRWDIIYDHRMQKRIDRANIDHCGPCGSMYIQNESNIDQTTQENNGVNNNTKKEIPTLTHYERKL